MIDRHRGESLNMVKVGDRNISDFFTPFLGETEYYGVSPRINRQCGRWLKCTVYSLSDRLKISVVERQS